MLLTNRFSKINTTDTNDANRDNDAKNSKNDAKSHFKSFKYLNSLFSNTEKVKIATLIKSIAKTIKTNCILLNVYQFTNKYANIPNKAVKKANKKVLKNSILIFIFSNSIRKLYHK